MNDATGVRLHDFVWGRDGAVPIEALPELWERADRDELAALTGHFAVHWQRGTRHWLVRDPLGVHKRFFAIDERGELVTSHFAHELVRAGIPFRRVLSVPSGHAVVLDTRTHEYSVEPYTVLRYGDPDAPMRDLEVHAARVRGALDGVFARLAAELEGRDVYVTLSGGLDSSTIAAMARQHLDPRGARPGAGPRAASLRAITFTTPDATASAASDLRFAREVAAHMEIPLEVVEASSERVLSHVADVLRHGQDFRDFNVHCGLVNSVLAEHLAGRADGGAPPVVLTGDTMNELVADYTPVEYAGERFYDLPRMSPGRLRRFLVLGLDSGDREIGVFGARGIRCIQPYALCASAYAELPGGFLSSSAAKRDLVLRVVGDRIPAAVYERPKVRAQVGSGDEVGGTLAAVIRSGLDARALRARFAELHGIRADDVEAETRAFIRGGVYRFAREFPCAR